MHTTTNHRKTVEEHLKCQYHILGHPRKLLGLQMTAIIMPRSTTKEFWNFLPTFFPPEVCSCHLIPRIIIATECTTVLF